MELWSLRGWACACFAVARLPGSQPVSGMSCLKPSRNEQALPRCQGRPARFACLLSLWARRQRLGSTPVFEHGLVGVKLSVRQLESPAERSLSEAATHFKSDCRLLPMIMEYAEPWDAPRDPPKDISEWLSECQASVNQTETEKRRSNAFKSSGPLDRQTSPALPKIRESLLRSRGSLRMPLPAVRCSVAFIS